MKDLGVSEKINTLEFWRVCHRCDMISYSEEMLTHCAHCEVAFINLDAEGADPLQGIHVKDGEEIFTFAGDIQNFDEESESVEQLQAKYDAEWMLSLWERRLHRCRFKGYSAEW